MMPIRDVVIFPHMMTPFVVGRESSVRALEEGLASDRKIFLATQHDASVDEPKPHEIYQVGTIANIVQNLKLPDGNIKVLVEGVERGKVLKLSSNDGYFEAEVRTVKYTPESTPVLDAAMQRVHGLFDQYVKLCQSLNLEPVIITGLNDPAKLSDTIAQNLQLSIEEKQELLEIFDPVERLNRIADVLDIEIEKLNMDRTIQTRVKRQMERAQKERIRRAEKKDRYRGDAQRRSGKSHAGTQEARGHAADVGRVDGLPQLPRLAAGGAVEEEVERDSQHRACGENPEPGSLWTGENQRPHPRVSRGAPAGEESQGLDSVLCR